MNETYLFHPIISFALAVVGFATCVYFLAQLIAWMINIMSLIIRSIKKQTLSPEWHCYIRSKRLAKETGDHFDEVWFREHRKAFKHNKLYWETEMY